MLKPTKHIKTFLILSTLSLGMVQPVTAHEFVYSPESAQRSNVNMPVLKADMDTLAYSFLLYGFPLHLEVEGATFNTTNVNAIRNATTISIPNVLRAYRAADNTVSYRISGESDLRAINSFTMTIDQSVLSVPHSLSITLPVYQDMSPPDTPHEEANTIASLTVDSVNADDFLIGSGAVYTIKLTEGEFPLGCSDAIAHSIIKTSNIQGIVRIWSKTANQIEFIVEGGHYLPNAGNWNFELGPDTNTLRKTLHVSTPIKY